MREHDGEQPDTERSREGVALLSGEVLAADGCGPLRGDAAAAMIEAAWRSSGAAGVAALDGVFAVALRDAGHWLAHRDSLGLCGLYCRWTAEHGWQITTQLAPIIRDAADSAVLDRRALHEYLRLLDIAPPHTLLRGVHAVGPGQLLRLEPADPVPTELPQPTLPRVRLTGFDDAVAELERRLQASIALCLQGASRPAVFLSGGIDSALLCALAARPAPHTVALTVGFDDAGLDEAPVAAQIAANLGLRHEVLRFSRAEYLAAFDRLAQGMDQPMADPAAMATLLAFDHCRAHFDAVLDGTGAEAVGVMPPRHVRLAVGVCSRVPAMLRRRLVRVMARVPALAGYTPILDFEHAAETLMRWRGFPRVAIEELCGEPVSLAQTTFYRTFARFGRGEHFLRCSALDDAMPSDRLTQALRLTGACVRFPYRARDVDGFVRQLPTDWRWLPGQPKRILAELLARCVPRSIWAGPKRGFTFPLHEFLAGDNWALVRRHLLDGRWLHRGLLRPEVVRRHAQQYIGGERRLMFCVWALVVLGAWLDAHEDLTIPPPGA